MASPLEMLGEVGGVWTEAQRGLGQNCFGGVRDGPLCDATPCDGEVKKTMEVVEMIKVAPSQTRHKNAACGAGHFEIQLESHGG